MTARPYVNNFLRALPMTHSQIALMNSLDLMSKMLGPMPIISRFLDRLRINRFLEKFVPHDDRRVKIAPAAGLGVLLRNVLASREPIYGLQGWAGRFDEKLLGLPPESLHLLNDDRIGRCLDYLFRVKASVFPPVFLP